MVARLLVAADVYDVADNCAAVRRADADAGVAMYLQSALTIGLWKASFTVAECFRKYIYGSDVGDVLISR